MSASAVNAEAQEQLFLPMFMPHEIEAMKKVIADRQAKQWKNKLRYWAVSQNPKRTHAFDNLSASLLDLPLGPVEDVELSTTFDPYNETVVGDAPPETGEAQKEEWSNEAQDQLHEAMVTYSLRLLNARGNGKEKKAILSWIFDPHALYYYRTKDVEKPGWEVIQPSEVPFCFELCCRLSGYDPDRIREGLVPILKKLDLEHLFKEVEDERNSEQRVRAAKVRDSFDIQHSRGAGKSRNHGAEAGAARGAGDRPVLRLRDGAAA